jgi:enoyl-CoA hydratase
MTIDKTILLERKGKVATLKIHKPPLNLLNTPLLQEIMEVLQSIKEDKGCRVLVLTGESDKVFIGGADMNEMKNLNPRTAKEFITLLHSVMKSRGSYGL